MFAPPVIAEDSSSCRTAADNMDHGDSFPASKSAGTLSCVNWRLLVLAFVSLSPGKSGNFVDGQEHDVYHASCVTVVHFNK